MNSFNNQELRCTVSLESGINMRFMKSSDGFVKFKSHWHDYMELIFVVEGSLNVVLDNRKSTAKANQLIIIPPKMLHEGTVGNDGVKVYSIFLDINALTNKTFASDFFFSPLLNGKIDFVNITEQPEIIDCVYELIQANNDANTIFTQGKIYELIGLLFEYSDLNNRQTVSIKIKRILEHIQEHYLEDITSKTICTKFGYTESHLCRLFKKNIGITISKYIQMLRIERAKELLQESDLEISKIAEICGFMDFSYFCRCFKTFVTSTPSQFRKKMKTKK